MRMLTPSVDARLEATMNESLSADYLMSFVSLPNVLGATGALFYVISMSMKTVIPLRITSIVSAACLLGS